MTSRTVLGRSKDSVLDEFLFAAISARTVRYRSIVSSRLDSAWSGDLFADHLEEDSNKLASARMSFPAFGRVTCCIAVLKLDGCAPAHRLRVHHGSGDRIVRTLSDDHQDSRDDSSQRKAP